MARTRKFKLIAGTHHDGTTGKSYKAGDVVSVDYDLAALFREKFLPIDEDPNPPVNEDLPRPANSAGGMAPQPSDQGAVSNITKQLVTPTTPNHATAGDDENADEDKGEDVTSDFDDAKENDFVVLQKGRKYFVYDKDDKSHSAPLDPEGGTKAEASKTIKSALSDNSKGKK